MDGIQRYLFLPPNHGEGPQHNGIVGGGGTEDEQMCGGGSRQHNWPDTELPSNVTDEVSVKAESRRM